MHVTTKDSSIDGLKHVLTSVIESDAASELCSATDSLSATVDSVTRTASGGIQLQVTLLRKPAAPETPLTLDEQAMQYLVSKKESVADATADLAKFGAARILEAKAAEEAKENQALNDELMAKLETAPKNESIQ